MTGRFRVNVVNLLIAHPDDEVMFFAPTLSQLQSIDNLQFNIVCFSNGNADGLGNIRAKELNDSISLLLKDQKFDIHLFDHIDGMKQKWGQDLMLNQLDSIIDTKNSSINNFILTFDDFGVSDHINHKACSSLAHNFKSLHNNITLLLLNSYGKNIFKKYSAFYIELTKLIFNSLKDLLEVSSNIKLYLPKSISEYLIRGNSTTPDLVTHKTLTFFSPFPKYIFTFATMLNAHQSQMAWFRYGWWSFSRFVFINDLEII